MNFQVAQFITSAPNLDACPDPKYPEICMAGRSNVGKSTLVNAITNKNKLARTSNVPGKTQLMNYYEIDEQLYLVDLPGYGFAKVPKEVREQWGRDIKSYLENRETLRLVLHIVDARRDPTKLDEEMFYWMGTHRLPFVVLLSKCDKLSNNKRQQSVAKVKHVLKEMNIEVPVEPYSATSGRGIREIQKIIQEFTTD
ncbi:MAG: ribosome biogenesis GTP-binding protein YihA/YsxC [Bacteroidota bacterium]